VSAFVALQYAQRSLDSLFPKNPTLTKFLYVYIIGHMDISKEIMSFGALSQETRLEAFRLLVRHEPEGLPAGEIARLLGIPHNTMSAHLSVLARAELVLSQRQSRSIIYRANLNRVQEIIRFLINDCCEGHPEVCEPLASSLVACTAQSVDS